MSHRLRGCRAMAFGRDGRAACRKGDIARFWPLPMIRVRKAVLHHRCVNET